MWLLWFVLLLQSAFFTEAEFGTPYLKNSRLCRPWDCVSRSLGLSSSLPEQNYYETVLTSLFPEEWHPAVEKAVDICYNKRPRQYVNTCNSQALLHCTLDNLIQNCPENSTRTKDACNPIATTAGMNYMFTQSRYKNLEENLPKERRPSWFMRQYFDTKCCNLPEIIKPSVLSDCGFRTFLRYYENEPQEHDEKKHYLVAARPKTDKGERLVVMKTNGEQDIEDPLDCCDMESFISPTSRSKCDFKLLWDASKRFSVRDHNVIATTVSPEDNVGPYFNKDVRIVPLSCAQETCIFRKLNVVSESGEVDLSAFAKVLDNFTALHPSWNKAKARVITHCLTKRNNDYSGDCQINELLSCTLDVFSENCPHKSKHDVCRHSRRNNTVCQISSSKYRPKHRRAICGMPHLVNSDVLSECGVTSISQIEYVPEPPVVKIKNIWPKDYSCQDSSPSTQCLMREMGILNKYNFLDYFKMKDKIRSFTANNFAWGSFTELYMNIFAALPLYKEYCNSPKKLLNVIDAMVMTCPISRRKNSRQCKLLFDTVIKSPHTEYRNISNEKLEKILKEIHRDFPSSTQNPSTVAKEIEIKTKSVFDYGILNSKNAPTDRTVVVQLEAKPISEATFSTESVITSTEPDATVQYSVKPSIKASTLTESSTKVKPSTKPPLVLLPVYMRMNASQTSARSLSPKEGIFQASTFKLHGRVNSTETLTTQPYWNLLV